jgi:hypothetical protein
MALAIIGAWNGAWNDDARTYAESKARFAFIILDFRHCLARQFCYA